MASITVVKLGGSTLGEHDTSLDDLAALHAEGERFIVVHGGGATISEWLDRHGVATRFVRGLRVTDAAALDVVVAVLAGLVNKQLVAQLEARGARAMGVSGADGAILRARRFDPELGLVGEISHVDAVALAGIVEEGLITVLAPIAVEEQGEGATGQLLNVNADTTAGEVALAVSAARLVFLTDVPGVLDGAGAVVRRVAPDVASGMIASGAVSSGMIPKVEAAVRAAHSGIRAIIADGRRPDTLRAALSASPEGTQIVA